MSVNYFFLSRHGNWNYVPTPNGKIHLKFSLRQVVILSKYLHMYSQHLVYRKLYTACSVCPAKLITNERRHSFATRPVEE